MLKEVVEKKKSQFAKCSKVHKGTVEWRQHRRVQKAGEWRGALGAALPYCGRSWWKPWFRPSSYGKWICLANWICVVEIFGRFYFRKIWKVCFHSWHSLSFPFSSLIPLSFHFLSFPFISFHFLSFPFLSFHVPCFHVLILSFLSSPSLPLQFNFRRHKYYSMQNAKLLKNKIENCCSGNTFNVVGTFPKLEKTRQGWKPFFGCEGSNWETC